MKFILIILTSITTSLVFGQQNDADRVLKEKREIENRIQSNKDDILVYVKIKNNPKPEIVLNENWPENIEGTYNILKNDIGQVIYFGEFPTSESGDWILELKHYFNKNGHTIAFEKRLSYFNDNCSDGAVTEILVDIYLANFKRHATIRQLLDGNDKAITDPECGDPYNWPIEKKATVVELLKLKKVEM